MKNTIRKFVNKLLLPHSKLAYAQSGEDVILDYLFSKLGIKNPSYLDIGANHPISISNSYLFYLKGSKGVCIEANPILAEKIKSVRPKDTVLAKGVGINDNEELDFYMFAEKFNGLSTFSKAEAEHWSIAGDKVYGKISYEKIIKVPIININTIINNHCRKVPDFVSLDVEGFDLQILKSLDFKIYKPAVLCVETLLYDVNQKESKNTELINFVTANGYKVYADTNINTIFLSQSL